MFANPASASHQARRNPLILRIGVVQRGRVIAERVLATPAGVSIGESPGNSLVLAGEQIPDRFLLFDGRAGRWYLHLDSHMKGRVQVNGMSWDFASLRDSSHAERHEHTWSVALDEHASGKVMLGDTTILFHFVAAPALRHAPALPAHMRGGPLRFMAHMTGIQDGFLIALVLSAALQIVFTIWLRYSVPPAARPPVEAALESMYAMGMQPPVPIPELPVCCEREQTNPEETTTPLHSMMELPVFDGRAEAAAAESNETAAGDIPDEIRQRTEQSVASQTAIGAIIAARDGLGGAIAGGGRINVDVAMRDVAAQTGAADANGIVSQSGLGLAHNDTQAERVSVVGQGGSSLTAQARDSVGSETSQQRDIPTMARVRPSPISTQGSGRLDSDALSSALARVQRRMQQCFERQLAVTPGISGRVRIQVTINTAGQVDDARIPDSELPREVDRCILGELRRWSPGVPEGGAVTVRRVYLFESGVE
jgi:TonB family protein